MYSKRSLGRCALVALIVSLSAAVPFSQKAAADKAATPVIVTNPNTNPAITSDIDNPGRAPYQSTDDQTCSGTLCAFSFTAPAGKRIVVQNVSGVLTTSSPPSQLQVSVSTSPSGQLFTGFTVPPFTGSFQAFNQQVLFYIDPGQSVGVLVSLVGATFEFGSGVTLAGYAVDCTVANCAKIVQ